MAIGASLVVHAALFAVAGRLHTRPVERTFFAPVHVVDLVERSPGPAAKPEAKGTPAPANPATPPAQPAPKPPPAKAVAAPVPKPPPTAQPAKPQPPPPKPEPKITRESVERLLTKPAPAEKPAAAQDPAAEARIAERISRLREQLAEDKPTVAPAPASPPPGEDSSRVRDAIDSIRQRVGPAGAGQAGSGSETAVGVRSGGGTNTLQQVRLRAYYNQLWDHVTRHWNIPSSLQGRPYSVIVSATLDRQGNLVRVWVEEPSGSDAFDQSALRALQRAQPLPAFPDTVSEDTLEVGFRFYPE